jgi:hypothetical protein
LTFWGGWLWGYFEYFEIPPLLEISSPSPFGGIARGIITKCFGRVFKNSLWCHAFSSAYT